MAPRSIGQGIWEGRDGSGVGHARFAVPVLVEALLLLVTADGGLLIASVIRVLVLRCVIARLLLVGSSCVAAAIRGLRGRAAEPRLNALAHQSGPVNHAFSKAAGRWHAMVSIGISGTESRVAEWVTVFIARITGVVERKVAIGMSVRLCLVSVLVVGGRCVRRFGCIVGLSIKRDAEQDNDKEAQPFHNSFPHLNFKIVG